MRSVVVQVSTGLNVSRREKGVGYGSRSGLDLRSANLSRFILSVHSAGRTEVCTNNSKDCQADAIDAPELHVDWMWAERRKAKGLFRSINSCSMADASNFAWLMVPSFGPCSLWARNLQWTNQRGERGRLFMCCCSDAHDAVCP